MAIVPCGVEVDGPQIAPRINGLFSVASPATPADSNWEITGVTWDESLCTDAFSRLYVCPPDDVGLDPKTPDRSFTFCCADPFIVYGSYDCPPVGRSANEAFDTATRRLLALEEAAVERAFWTGALTDNGQLINPSLTGGNDTCEIVPADLTPASGAVSVVAGIALLESVLAECVPGVGVIHANYGLAAYLANASLLREDARGYRTPTGQRLALGAGYLSQFGPGGDPAPDGETWIFATGPVGIWRSEIFLTPPRLEEAVDRTLNNVRVFAERVYAVGFSCCLSAVRVTLQDCC